MSCRLLHQTVSDQHPDVRVKKENTEIHSVKKQKQLNQIKCIEGEKTQKTPKLVIFVG